MLFATWRSFGGWGGVLVGVVMLATTRRMEALEAMRVPMTAEWWTAEGAKTKLQFSRMEGFPLGLMKVSDEGEAVLQASRFGMGRSSSTLC